ncbi:transcriptional regulator with XRE-family HTH domain [Kitasatospora sp. MAP12-15]|uniref:helix-turn-helix domain-containing protein n=1 Tax=unclassified Kitasatospora TaxID=2633591 RepID=UPI0024733660|nr:helix-turn-helix transcriptional regulator [Kitasatospora sp. MAP12-44]MDH6108840.1 transcriptional regulator with XRE-family HTH domain [Kitasatospora sp. MAP12-44]
MNLKRLDPSKSPLAAFGDQLRRSRNEKGWTQDQLGDRMGCSGGHISGLETAAKSPGRKFAIRADAVFGTGLTFQILWQAVKNQAFLEGFPEYVAKEAHAKTLRFFQTRIIPGLLQTEEYAAALESGYVQRGKATQDQADGRVRFLMDRQRILHATPAPSLHSIMDEVCLRRPIGGRGVMVRQLRHLEELYQRPKTTIQIAPDSLAEAHPLNHPVTLLTLPGRVVLGYTETLQRGYLERDSETVESWASDYDQLAVEALSRAASLALIRKIREELEHG